MQKGVNRGLNMPFFLEIYIYSLSMYIVVYIVFGVIYHVRLHHGVQDEMGMVWDRTGRDRMRLQLNAIKFKFKI